MSSIARKSAAQISINKKGIKLAKRLTYAGTLPLLACIVGIVVTKVTLAFHIIASAYAGVIIAFVCGIHWTVYLFIAEKCPINLLISSNVIALAAWLSLLIRSAHTTYIMQLSCFGVLLLLEYKLVKIAILPEWFWQLRRNATLIVCLSLIILLSMSYFKSL